MKRQSKPIQRRTRLASSRKPDYEQRRKRPAGWAQYRNRPQLLGPCVICGLPAYRPATSRKRKTPGNYTCSAECLSALKSRQQLARARPWQDRFWEHVLKSDSCWIWTSTKHRKTGYGEICIRRRHVSVHRLSYEMHHGPIPADMFVLHHCDVPLCVNPVHLYAGTHADNMRDMVNRGRAPSPANDGRPKLTATMVQEIRRLTGTLPQSALARNYGVSPRTIRRVQAGKTRLCVI